MANKSDKNSNIRIGKLLQTARESHKLSQSALAKEIGMSTNHISAIERGSSKGSIDTLLGYCNALHMSPDEILGYKNNMILPELHDRLSQMPGPEQKKVLNIIKIINRKA